MENSNRENYEALKNTIEELLGAKWQPSATMSTSLCAYSTEPVRT